MSPDPGMTEPRSDDAMTEVERYHRAMEPAVPSPSPPAFRDHAVPKPVRSIRLPGSKKRRHAYSQLRGPGVTKPLPEPAADARARRKRAKQSRRRNR